MKIYNGYILDADNTLFDFSRSQREALAALLGMENGSREEEDAFILYRNINQQLWGAYERGEIDQTSLRTERFRILFEQLGPASPSDWKDRVADYAAEFMSLFTERPHLFPDTIPVLEVLSQKAKLVMGTNGFSETQHKRIAGTGIGKFFHDIIISGEIGVQKPDPLFFRTCLESLEMEPSQVLCVGDNYQADILGALDAGIDGCWFKINDGSDPPREPSSRPITVIRRLNELLPEKHADATR